MRYPRLPAAFPPRRDRGTRRIGSRLRARPRAENGAGLVLLPYRLVAPADAQGGGRDHHRHGRLADVMLVGQLAAVGRWHRHDGGNRATRPRRYGPDRSRRPTPADTGARCAPHRSRPGLRWLARPPAAPAPTRPKRLAFAGANGSTRATGTVGTPGVDTAARRCRPAQGESRQKKSPDAGNVPRRRPRVCRLNQVWAGCSEFSNTSPTRTRSLINTFCPTIINILIRFLKEC